MKNILFLAAVFIWIATNTVVIIITRHEPIIECLPQ